VSNVDPTIAVVGAGSVGGNLARRLAGLGHPVVLAARNPASSSVRALAGELPDVGVVGLADAGRDADVVVLAVPAAAVVDAASAVLGRFTAGRELVIVDATNDVAGTERSPYERVVESVAGRTGVAVVKAFNTIGAEAILDPVIDGRPAFLPIAGPPDAAEAVRAIAAAIGFDARAIGGPGEVHHLEAHARLWIHLAFRAGLGRAFGFAIVERSAP
jgi:predicted dinucleotide-binding enzyme